MSICELIRTDMFFMAAIKGFIWPPTAAMGADGNLEVILRNE